VLDLTNWKLTLPIDTPHAGSPDEIRQPELATFADAAYFHVAGSAVVFTAPIQGATTSGSGYPRSELREMANGGKDNASWSSTSGSHSMTVTEAITHTPVVKPHVVAAQIHDASDDVVMVRLEGKHLFVEHDGTNLGDLDVNYQLGAYFTVRITATGGQVTVDYNGVPKVHYQAAGSGWYFKAGAYTQSNLSKGDAAGAYGEVAIKGLTVTHS
jgi:poly(beta-D-mannuronate) lyase